MPHWHPKSCRRCPASVYDGTPISATGLCPECGRLALLENNRQLQAHSGPLFEWWRVRCLQAFGVNLAQLAATVDAATGDGHD